MFLRWVILCRIVFYLKLWSLLDIFFFLILRIRGKEVVVMIEIMIGLLEELILNIIKGRKGNV